MNTASFLTDVNYSEDRVVIDALITSPFGKEIRIAFQKGQIMKEHKTKFPITVSTVKGLIAFRVQGKTIELAAGDVIALEGSIMHELEALEQSVVRLSLHQGDSVERVAQVAD